VESVSPVFPGGQVPGFLDPIVALTRASMATSTIQLGTSILLLLERHPIALAKSLATLDLYSGGRVQLGIGVGWLKEERVMLGGDALRPWAQTREAVNILKSLWANEAAEFHGEFYDFPAVRCFPKPAQRPHVPVLVGGISRFVLPRVVEYGDGWLPHRITPVELKARIAELGRLAEEKGRSLKDLPVSVTTTAISKDLLRQYEDAGASRMIVNAAKIADERQAAQWMEEVARACF